MRGSPEGPLRGGMLAHQIDVSSVSRKRNDRYITYMMCFALYIRFLLSVIIKTEFDDEGESHELRKTAR